MGTIPVDIDGLNLVLGGGISVLKRHPTFADESATVLIRGPAGSGKTILGVQLAGSLGRALGCDVAYGCVEILPSELSAQHAGIKRPEIRERVVMAPFVGNEPKSDECRVFAGMLEIASSENIPLLAEACVAFLEAVERSGGVPRVLVIDSLSDGYGLGASVPRALADDLCKMAAQRGMILVLLEETVEGRSSAWGFAVDVVLELGQVEVAAVSGASDSIERSFRVTKNRFGSSELGTHRFLIMPQLGIVILPGPRTYLSSATRQLILPEWTNVLPTEQGWPFKVPSKWPRFKECVVAVYGPEAPEVSRVARGLGVSSGDGGTPVVGVDVLLDLSQYDEPVGILEEAIADLHVIGCGDPYAGGSLLLKAAIFTLNDLKFENKLVRRVLVGDLQSLRVL
ncbi:MAG: ATPase domain-containing protein [Byssovorax sp.]